MTHYTAKAGLKVHTVLAAFIDQQVLPELNKNSEQFWQSMTDLISDLAPINQQLLKKRSALQ